MYVPSLSFLQVLFHHTAHLTLFSIEPNPLVSLLTKHPPLLWTVGPKPRRSSPSVSLCLLPALTTDHKVICKHLNPFSISQRLL